MSTSRTVSDRGVLRGHRQELVDRVVACLQEGSYCAVLGPLLSGKTESLRYLERALAPFGWRCIYINLYDVRASTLREFFGDLVALAGRRIGGLDGVVLPASLGDASSSAVFRAFLGDVVMALGCDLVLVLDHLEALPTDLVQALLTSLRAAYMDQQTMDRRLLAVVSGALSLATLTMGESSPFRGIAQRVFVEDLSEEDSAAMIDAAIAAGGVTASDRSRQLLLRAACGDPHLIHQLCTRCVEAARATASNHLRANHVNRITQGFLRDEVSRYAPLLEAVRLIEDDPDLLDCILLLLRHGIVPRSQLPLPLSPDMDPLYLTGVVERVEGDRYRVQNVIYRQFLAEHFRPGRVGHVLAMAGRWDAAIDYLEAGVRTGDEQARADLLPATIHSIYASEDLGQAAYFLARGLCGGFEVREAQVWCTAANDGCLRLVGRLGRGADGRSAFRREVPMADDSLEARACRQARALRGAEGDDFVWRAIPLLSPGRQPVGVVTLCDSRPLSGISQQRERDLRLSGYLNQAARAIVAVSTRRRELAQAGQLQSGLLPRTMPRIEGWEIAAAWRPARETSGDFYDFIALPDGRIGIVVADVADKGIGAALYMALSRTLIRTFAAEFSAHPDYALRAASERILAETESGLFVTAFYGVLDTESGALTYCNAGHHPPYLLGADVGGVNALPGKGMALGVMKGTNWGQTTLEISPGASLLLFTDGVVDAHNREMTRFGNDRLVKAVSDHAVASAQGLVDEVLAQLRQFAGDEPQFDDITLVAIKRKD